MPPHKGALLLMAWSTSSGVFSFLTGKLADKFSRYRVEIFQCAMVGVAISTSLLSAAWSFQSFMGMMVIYGAFDSGFVSLKAVVAEDLVGSDQASKGVGIMFAVLGIAYCAGIPLAGKCFGYYKLPKQISTGRDLSSIDNRAIYSFFYLVT